jgi:hypothetical protein
MQYTTRIIKRKSAIRTKGKIKGDIVLRCICKDEEYKNSTSLTISKDALLKMAIGVQLIPDIPTSYDSYCGELIKIESNAFILTKFHHTNTNRNIAYEVVKLEVD